jgi:hypothetical protein
VDLGEAETRVLLFEEWLSVFQQPAVAGEGVTLRLANAENERNAEAGSTEVVVQRDPAREARALEHGRSHLECHVHEIRQALHASGVGTRRYLSRLEEHLYAGKRQPHHERHHRSNHNDSSEQDHIGERMEFAER